MEGFGAVLRQRARDLGLTDVEVARRAGLEEARYGNYVRDSREPDLETLIKISRVLGTTPNALLGIDDDNAIDHRRVQAAVHALTEDDRELAFAILNTIIDHRKRRPGPAHS